MSLNPENKCADLFKDDIESDISISDLFNMQLSLQKFLAQKGRAVDYETASFKEKVDDISRQWRNLNLEVAELLERLPYKEWKSYPEAALQGFESEEQKLETQYEFVDCMHFMLNIGLALGINGEIFKKLYISKNKENFKRQNEKYK